MCYKILLKSSQFCSSERLWSPKNTCTPPWILQLLKKPLGKLADADDIDTLEAMRFELSINGVADGVLETVEICVLWDCVWDCVGYTFQLRCRWPGAVVWDALLAAMPGDEHYMAVGYIRIWKHGYCWSPDGMIAVHLREIRSFGCDLHHVSQLVHAKWAVFIPHDVFCGESGFWFLKERWAGGIQLGHVQFETGKRIIVCSSAVKPCFLFSWGLAGFTTRMVFCSFFVGHNCVLAAVCIFGELETVAAKISLSLPSTPHQYRET